MNITESVFWMDIKEILLCPIPPQKYFELIIITPEKEVKCKKLITWDSICNYQDHVTQEMYVKAYLRLGDYMKDVHPHLNMLNAKILLYDGGSHTITYKYRAILPEDAQDSVDPEQMKVFQKENLDSDELYDITLQLIEKVVQPIQMLRLRGVYKNQRRKDFIRAVKEETIKRTSVVDGKHIQFIDITKPNHEEKFEQITLPTHSKPTRVPRMVQNQYGGLYGGGIGTFITMWEPPCAPPPPWCYCDPDDLTRPKCPDKLPTKEGYMNWFTYPLTDTTQYVKQGPCEKIIAYCLNDTSHNTHFRTWRFHEGYLRIVILKSQISGETLEGRRAIRPFSWKNTKPDEYMHRPVIVTPDQEQVIGSENRLHKEIIAEPREDGYDDVPCLGDSTHDNWYSGASGISRNMAIRMDFIWNRSEDIYVKPGMPFRLYVEQDKGVVIYDAILQYKHTIISLEGKGWQEEKHQKTTWLTFAAEEIE